MLGVGIVRHTDVPLVCIFDASLVWSYNTEGKFHDILTSPWFFFFFENQHEYDTQGMVLPMDLMNYIYSNFLKVRNKGVLILRKFFHHLKRKLLHLATMTPSLPQALAPTTLLSVSVTLPCWDIHLNGIV